MQAALAMQKRCRRAGETIWQTFDTRIPRAYPNGYVLPLHRQSDVLLSPLAGVWVGLKREILPTHPAKRVGYHFHPLLTV